MNRRSLFKGVAGLTAGLILPPTLVENVEAVRRYWALDRTMVPGSDTIAIRLGRNANVTALLEALHSDLSAWVVFEHFDGEFSTYTRELIDLPPVRPHPTYTLTNAYADDLTPLRPLQKGRADWSVL